MSNIFSDALWIILGISTLIVFGILFSNQLEKINTTRTVVPIKIVHNDCRVCDSQYDIMLQDLTVLRLGTGEAARTKSLVISEYLNKEVCFKLRDDYVMALC